ncbi:hypothetical protein [Celerinatantimonas diazotrophica]|uniref:SmpA/OmlA family protein n=1 Tax=Celerinatantimonas diazotrophica TaxID=412034 RepID=A0A4R1K2D3_9GAMM|nr:hypothetical protein [Celerinatantimonas diazotrophica]TCK58090.1 hypothetical protein EV690_1798 [Celerinatantimonas diazotrophica]CAG9297838.1 hypothetical protein CEDIAZO_03029 [Celerinatantimonas diazotrophica]
MILTGCASSGNQSLKNETPATIQSKITKGVTTKNQVRAMFGDPAKTSFTDKGNMIWEYDLADVSGDAVNYIPIVNLFGSSSSGTKKQLIVMFKKDVVFQYSMSNSPVAIKTGLFK